MSGNSEDAQSPAGINIRVGSPFSLETFQESTDSLNGCLLLNQQYQNELNRIITHLQIVLQQNLQNQRQIPSNDKKKRYFRQTERRPVSKFLTPYFVDLRGRIVPDNEDAVLKRKREDVDAYVTVPKFWVGSEKKRLTESVFRIVRQQELMPYLNRRSYLHTKLKGKHLQPEEEQQLRYIIEELSLSIKEIRKKTNEKLLEEKASDIDWLQVSTVCMSGTRGPEECERKWNMMLHPSINTGKFLSKEDKTLKKLAASHEERDWETIAEELGTDRNGIQCIQRYYGTLVSISSRKYWSKEDDVRLEEIVNACTIGDTIIWHQVTYHMMGWTRMQVVNRWFRCLRPENSARPWSLEEDAVLCGAYQKYPLMWKKIATFIPGHTNYQCRFRYTNNLMSNLNGGNWTLEDDRKLFKYVADCGNRKWSRIGTIFGNRTDSSCALRYAYIHKKTPVVVRRILKKLREGVSPELAMKSLLVKSTTRSYKNQNNQELRKTALEKFEEVVRRLCPNPPTEPNVSDWIVPNRILKKISDELLSHTPVDDLPLRQPCYKQMEKSATEDEMYSSSESEDEESIEASESSEEDTEFTLEEQQDIDEELDALFVTRAAAAVNNMRKTFLAPSATQAIECQVLKYILSRDFLLKNPQYPDRTSYKDVDFVSSVQNVIDMFVYPPPEEGCMPVLPPNLASMNGMISLILNQKFLESLAQKDIPEELLTNFKSIAIDAPKADRRCTFCRTGKSNENNQTCECHVIQQLRERFLLFRKRFICAFLWPALLSDMKMTKKQIEKLILGDIPKIQTINVQSAEKPPKRVKLGNQKEEPNFIIL